MGDMRLQQPNHSNHRISQFQPNNHQHHNHQMPPNLHPSLQRRQRFTNNLNRAEFMPHSRAPASSIALRVAMNNRDFTPDDYEVSGRVDSIWVIISINHVILSLFQDSTQTRRNKPSEESPIQRRDRIVAVFQL